MKIAVFTDIHGNYEALKIIIEDIQKEKINNIICLGDTIGIGPNPKECLDLIIENNISMTLGNHELYYLNKELYSTLTPEEIEHQKWVSSTLNKSHYEYLKNCPLSIEKEIFNKKLLFEHFLIKDKDNYPFYPIDITRKSNIKEIINNTPNDYIFIGHNHKPFELTINNKNIVCLGSSGCTKDNITKYTIINITDKELTITSKHLPYNKDKFTNELLSVDYPCKQELSKIFFNINL